MTCPHGELSPAGCLDCLEGTPPPLPPRPTAVRGEFAIEAARTSWCSDCGGTIEAGDWIVPVDDTDGRTWVHQECP